MCEVSGTQSVLWRAACVSVDINHRAFVLSFNKELLSNYCVWAPRSASAPGA